MGYNILPLIRSINTMPPVKPPKNSSIKAIRCVNCGSSHIYNYECEHCGTRYKEIKESE